jgi:rRNA maturation endonuclease Nob1
MIAHTSINGLQDKAAVHEAMRIVATQTFSRRRVCVRCGMIHTSSAPVMCDSCGSPTTPLQAELPREMNSHW